MTLISANELHRPVLFHLRFVLLKLFRAIGFFLVLISIGNADAKDVSSMYSIGELEQAKSVYGENVRWNWESIIKRNLTLYEGGRLKQVTLELPLIGEGTSRGNPFTIYGKRLNQQYAIVLPILTLRFLDDLTIATAWLNAKGYSLETLASYVAYLKYAPEESFPESKFPQPLEALGLTREDALSDTKIDEVAQKLYKSLVVWLLAHELGHALYADDLDEKQGLQEEIEQQADAFALELMRRVRAEPVGIGVYFNLLYQWQKVESETSDPNQWTEYVKSLGVHVISAPRLLALSRSLESGFEKDSQTSPFLSRLLRQTADLVQAGNILRPKEFDMELLKPQGLVREETPNEVGGLYTAVYKAFVKSYIDPDGFGQHLASAGLANDTRFKKCLQQITKRVAKNAIE